MRTLEDVKLCPECGSENTRVQNTRHSVDTNVLDRQRICMECGCSYHTVEILKSELEELLLEIEELKKQITINNYCKGAKT